MKKHYETLGVPEDADVVTIKKAYRRLARKYHPDVSKEPDAKERFQEVQAAYDTLSDPEKRARYDRTGEDGPRTPTLEERVQALVAQVITQIICSEFDGNIVAEMTRHFNEQISESEKNNSKLKDKIAKLQRRRGKISTKLKENLFHQIIDEQIQKMERMIEGNYGAAQACKTALKILADYTDATIEARKEDVSKLFEDDYLKEILNRQRGRTFKFQW